MTDEPDTLSAEAIRARANAFLSLKWVHLMYAYVRTIRNLNAPEPPADRPGMVTVNRHNQPILTVPQLMTRTKANAERWEPLLGDMLDVARPIKEYAITSTATIKVIYQLSREKLAPAVWTKLDLDARQQLKNDFSEMVEDLITAAEQNRLAAVEMRDRILAYRKDVVADHDESEDVQHKYKDWMAEEDKTLRIWEEAHGLQPGETENLILALQADVSTYNAKWAGLTAGAVSTAGGTVAFGLVVFPPLGAIGGLIGMSVMAAQAAEAKRLMEEFAQRLSRVEKYNVVKIFFRTMDTTLKSIMEATSSAADALGQVAGLWALIAADLKSVQGETIGVSGLAGSKPWEAPVKLVKRMGAEEAYKALIAHCDTFVEFGYVQNDPIIINAGR